MKSTNDLTICQNGWTRGVNQIQELPKLFQLLSFQVRCFTNEHPRSDSKQEQPGVLLIKY